MAREGYTIVCLPPQDKPVYFVLANAYPSTEDGLLDSAEADASQQYFYEEHSCPTNWLQPEVVAFDGDLDPHGLIEYVRRVPADQVMFLDEAHLNGDWLSVFPELAKTPETAPLTPFGEIEKAREEGRRQGLRDAAEIARQDAATYRAAIESRPRTADGRERARISHDRMVAAEELAAAIEAKAGEK